MIILRKRNEISTKAIQIETATTKVLNPNVIGYKKKPQYFNSFYRVNNELVTTEAIEVQCTINASLTRTIPDYQRPSQDSLPKKTVFPNNTPQANNLHSLKFEAKMIAIKSYIQCELSTLTM